MVIGVIMIGMPYVKLIAKQTLHVYIGKMVILIAAEFDLNQYIPGFYQILIIKATGIICMHAIMHCLFQFEHVGNENDKILLS